MPVEYRLFEGPLKDDVLDLLVEINQRVFGFGESARDVGGYLGTKRKLLLCLALEAEEAVGFKFGFEGSPGCFESDRGGVLEDFRRQGVASALMEMQHQWCREKGFRVVKTITNNDNRPMIIANLKAGFEIVGCFVNRGGKLKVLQEKSLASP